MQWKRTDFLFVISGICILIWFTSLFWNHTDLVFTNAIHGDGILTIYFYKLIAHNWYHDINSQLLYHFSYPVSPSISQQFPSQTEAYIIAPLIHHANWTETWSILTTWSFTINAIGMIIFLQAIGFKKWCIPIACLWVIGMRPIYVDILLGRYNVTTIGYAFLCAGSFLSIVNQRKTNPFHIVLFLFSAIPAIEVYPFFMLMLLPIVLIYIKNYKKTCLYLILPLSILLLREDTLMQIMEANGAYIEKFQSSSCPNPVTTLPQERLFLENVYMIERASHGIFWWVWIPLIGLLFSKRNWLVLLYTLFLGIVTMGPCSDWYWLWPEYDWSFLWNTMHDLSRITTVLVCFPLIGLCNLIRKNKTLGLLFGFPFLMYYTQQHLTEIQSPHYWQPKITSPIQDIVPEYGFVVLLPFDQLQQFLYVLQHPNIALVNPLSRQELPRQNPDFYEYIFDLGKDGSTNTSSTIRCQELQYERISTIIYHPDLCKYATINENDCRQKLPTILQNILDIPLKKTEQLYVWSCE